MIPDAAPLPFAPTVRIMHRQSTGWAIAFSVLLILLGLAALALPFLAGVAITGILAWLLIFGGVAHLVLAFHVRGTGAHFWEAFIGLAYLVAGGFLFLHPVAGLISLTAMLAVYLVIKGIFELVVGIQTRGIPGSGWLILNAVISLIIAVVIWTHLFAAASWALGTLVGIAILFSGISRLAFALAARRHHATFLEV